MEPGVTTNVYGATTWGNAPDASWVPANFSDPGVLNRSPATPATVGQLAVKPHISVLDNAVDTFAFTGKVNTDPHVVLLQFITNSSGADWTSFDVRVEAGANSLLATSIPASPPALFAYPGNPFPNVIISTDDLTYANFHFYGAIVPNTTSIVLGTQFDIALVNSYPGNFAYHIANSPTVVPEPASLGLLGLGVMGLLRRRR